MRDLFLIGPLLLTDTSHISHHTRRVPSPHLLSWSSLDLLASLLSLIGSSTDSRQPSPASTYTFLLFSPRFPPDGVWSVEREERRGRCEYLVLRCWSCRQSCGPAPRSGCSVRSGDAGRLVVRLARSARPAHSSYSHQTRADHSTTTPTYGAITIRQPAGQ